VRVIFAPGTNASLGSLMTPRSEVLAVWADTREEVVRMQKSIHPHRDLFTTVPPKGVALRLLICRFGLVVVFRIATA
jgi:hypothetical protein